MPYFVSSSEQKLIHRFKDPITDTVTMSLLDPEIIVPLGGTRLSFLDAQKLAHGYHCPLVSEESCAAALGIIHRFQSALKSIFIFLPLLHVSITQCINVKLCFASFHLQPNFRSYRHKSIHWASWQLPMGHHSQTRVDHQIRL